MKDYINSGVLKLKIGLGKQKPSHLLPPIFEHVSEGTPFPAILSSFLACWKNLNKLLGYKIFNKSFHLGQEENFQIYSFQTPTKCLSQIKVISNYYIPSLPNERALLSC